MSLRAQHPHTVSEERMINYLIGKYYEHLILKLWQLLTHCHIIE